MARPLRIEYPGALYHVVSRGNGRLWLFRHDKAFHRFLDGLGRFIKKYRVAIHNFVLMRNHFHLIVETRLPNLSGFMSQILRDYAVYYNRVNRRRGSVFQSRYGAFLVQKDVYYKQLTKYVFYNPVKAGIVKRPYDYEWSSLHYIMRVHSGILWFDPQISLSLIGSKAELVSLLDCDDVPAEIPMVYNQFIGKREWADDLIDKRRLSEEIRGSPLMEQGYVTPEEILHAVGEAYKKTRAMLLRGDDKIATMIVMYLLNVHTPMQLDKLGRLFGLKKFTVAQRLWRFKNQGLSNANIKRIIKSLERRLLGK